MLCLLKKKKRTEEELHTIATVRIHGQKSKKKSKYIRFKKKQIGQFVVLYIFNGQDPHKKIMELNMKLCVLPLHGCQSESSITADGMNTHLAKLPTNI